jgi:hypothetical protein
MMRTLLERSLFSGIASNTYPKAPEKMVQYCMSLDVIFVT